jgi:putative membrane-bound dehydrogenase-like protein
MRLVATFFASPLVVALVASLAHAAEPRVLLDGAKLELVAREPDIVTPIGMAFDQKGRLLVVESHTHQRPTDYVGPKGDRIRMLSDSDGDGRLDRWSTFAEGYQQAMNLCVRRPDGAVYLVTRRDVRILYDTDDDGVSDKEMIILHLETTGQYPHNGMSGIAFVPVEWAYKDDQELLEQPSTEETDPAGTLVVGIGENSGIPYTLVGKDDKRISRYDGAGAIYECDLHGTQLRRQATGFWNPFGLCYSGRNVFCVDNDPDASPPCRLINVWHGGDYGFRYQYGRAGVHPLLAWNGELPGTLPPICGVGEAPTAIVAHLGSLWVTSWGDHRIERYDLELDSASRWQASRSIVVQGDTDFRPTGMVIAPNGDVYFSDWVNRSYPVHGRGRIWRLQLPKSAARRFPVRMESHWQGSSPEARLLSPLRSDGERAASGVREVKTNWDQMSAVERVGWLQYVRWYCGPPGPSPLFGFGGGQQRPVDGPEAVALLRRGLTDPSADVRLYAVRWIADERIKELRDDVAKLLDGEIPDERYFLAVIAAIEWLDGDAKPRSGGISDGLLRGELANKSRSPALKAIALRLISPDHPWLTIEKLREFVASDSEELRREAVRTLAMQPRGERFAVLAEIASDAARDPGMRADAVAGLAADIANQDALLATLAEGDESTVAREAARVLRLNRKRVETAEQVPAASDLDAWDSLLGEGGDAEAGRRLFFMSGGPQCAACHQHSGRGGRVGPDLTLLGGQQSRERVIASILQPSREIAPHYQAWELRTSDGLTRVGLRLPKGGDDGIEPYADSTGRRFELRSEEIELRSPAEASIMPEGLSASLSVDDLRDLVAFLSAKK